MPSGGGTLRDRARAPAPRRRLPRARSTRRARRRRARAGRDRLPERHGTSWLTVEIPAGTARRRPAPATRTLVTFAPFGSDGRDRRRAASRHAPTLDGATALEGTGLRARLRARAQRCARRHPDPYDVRAGGAGRVAARRHLHRAAAAEHGRRSTASCSRRIAATASTSPARWRCCCGWRRPGARRGRLRARAAGPQAQRRVRGPRLSTPTPGSRPTSRASAGSPSTRRRPRRRRATRRRTAQLGLPVRRRARRRRPAGAIRPPALAAVDGRPGPPARGPSRRSPLLAPAGRWSSRCAAAPPSPPELPAGARRARARAARQRPAGGAGDDARRPRAALRRRRRRRAATCARSRRSASPPAARRRPSASAARCAASSPRGSGAPGACGPGGRCRRGRSRRVRGALSFVQRAPEPLAAVRAPVPLSGADGDAYELFRNGTRLLEAGDHHAAVVPLSRARDLEPTKGSVREALGRALFGAQRYREAAEEFARRRRARADQRLRAVLPGPLAAADGPPRRGAPPARARQLPAPRARRLPPLPRSVAAPRGVGPARSSSAASISSPSSRSTSRSSAAASSGSSPWIQIAPAALARSGRDEAAVAVQHRGRVGDRFARAPRPAREAVRRAARGPTCSGQPRGLRDESPLAFGDASQVAPEASRQASTALCNGAREGHGAIFAARLLFAPGVPATSGSGRSPTFFVS